MGAADFVTPSMIAGAVQKLKFNKSIQSFEFKPSLGIVAKAVDRWAIDIRSFREPLKRSIQQVMIPSFRKNFATGGRPPWDPLAEPTIRKRNFSAWPILVRSGKLSRGVTTLKIWTITPAAATIKDLPDRIWYGKVHQAGYEGDSNMLGGGKWFDKYKNAARRVLGEDATDKEVTDLGMKMFDKRMLAHGSPPGAGADIPARPFAVFQDEDLDDIQEIFADWLIERARRAGVFG
jgi:phage gpG-like protein